MSRGHQPSTRTIAEVAWLYYIKNLTQGDIAKRLNLSRPTVISYLKQAKDREIVCVKISGEHFRINALADALSEIFGLEAALVVPDEGQGGEVLSRPGPTGSRPGMTTWHRRRSPSRCRPHNRSQRSACRRCF